MLVGSHLCATNGCRWCFALSPSGWTSNLCLRLLLAPCRYRRVRDLQAHASSFDLLFLSETLVSDNKHSVEFLIPGFSEPHLLYRRNIPNAQGMVVYIRSGMPIYLSSFFLYQPFIAHCCAKAFPLCFHHDLSSAILLHDTFPSSLSISSLHLVLGLLCLSLQTMVSLCCPSRPSLRLLSAHMASPSPFTVFNC